eukprot:g16152.t1
MRLHQAFSWLLAMRLLLCLVKVACTDGDSTTPADGYSDLGSLTIIDYVDSCDALPTATKDEEVAIAMSHLTIGGPISCESRQLKDIRFVRDTIVTSEQPVVTKNLAWLIESGVTVTVKAPSVSIRRSKEVTHIPMVISEGRMEVIVTDEAKPPRHHKPVDVFRMASTTEFGNIDFATNGEAYYSKYAMVVSAKRSSDNGLPAPTTSPTAAGAAAAPATDGNEKVNVNVDNDNEDQLTGAADVKSKEPVKQASTNDELVDTGRDAAASSDAATATATATATVADADRKDDTVDNGSKAGSTSGGTTTTGSEADNGEDSTTATATTTTINRPAATDDGIASQDGNQGSSGGGSTTNGHTSSSSSSSSSRTSSTDGATGGGDSGKSGDHPGGGNSGGGNRGGGNSGGGNRGGFFFSGGPLPENMQPHDGPYLLPGEKLTGGLLSSSGMSATYIDHEGATVMFSTKFESEHKQELIVERAMMEPSAKKLAKLKQLRQEVEEDRADEKTGGSSTKKTKKQALLGLQPFGKFGWRHKRAKERLQEHEGEAFATISDKGVVTVSVDGRVMITAGATFGGFFRQKDSTHQLRTTDVGIEILRQGKVIGAIEFSIPGRETVQV